jgi:redox-sensitive bicupin YhaK (pirin superfamily)
MDVPGKPSERLIGVYPPGPEHWVGDGFFVRTVFHPQQGADLLSPFLLLDFSDPRHFEPASVRRGVGEHPHRGFETVTFAFEGEVEHRDSWGGGGLIGPGDVQWMTAASGVVHEEKHSQRLTREGGRFSMAQLWVNLPARKKMSAPGYQALRDADFPRVDVGAATGRLVAGQFGGHTGPASTHSPLLVTELIFHTDGAAEFSLPEGWNALAVTLQGEIHAQSKAVPLGHLALFDPSVSADIVLKGRPGDRVLLLSGEPLDEPVVAHGPFVMNNWDEIRRAISDYERGLMGRL